ncbi:MAG: ABC transporter substrate-binding protein [Candidatus Hydrogenedentes bacterium]|nr:ABC transporter substrate-binding protein [Candidatus Hydrogenedentota bacterium]
MPEPSGNPPPRPIHLGIISMAPNLTETVYALGLGERVIAVGDYDDWPPEVNQLPRVGGYLDPDFEKITMLSPGMILLPGKHQQVSEYAALNHLPVLNVDMDSLKSIDEGIATLGEALGAQEAASGLRHKLQEEIAAVREATQGLARPQVLIITSRQSRDLNQLYTTGGDSFVSEYVALAGGDNIYGDSTQRYLEASKETVVVKAPDVILEFHAGAHLSETDRAALVADWDALPSLPAVKEQRIYLLTESHALRPGPRVVEMAWKVARLLHPEADLGT